jgi:hypothetical protein
MEYLESDLSVASYLLAKGFEFLGLELVGTRYSFKFKSGLITVDAVSATQEYRKGALIPARDFAAAIQQLKSVLYQEKFRNGNGNERHDGYGR